MPRQRLKTSTDIMRVINRIIMAVEAGELNVKTGNCVLYGCSVASNVLRNIEMEQRLDTLEKAAEQATGPLRAVK